MAISLGDIDKQNQINNSDYTIINGLRVKKNYLNKVNSKSNKNKWFQSGAFSDGYQFGDVTKTILGTAGDIGSNITKGVLRAGESIGDLAAYGGAQVVDWLGAHNYANQVREAASEDLTGKIFKSPDKVIDKNSILGEKADDVISSIGNMYAQGVTSAKLLGAKGNIPLTIAGKNFNLPVTSIISGASSGMGEAVQKNAEDWQIWANGITGGLAEGIPESLFGTFGIGGSDLDDAIVNGITKNMKNGLVKSLTRAGIKATGEGVEEVASYLLNYGSQHLLDLGKNMTGAKGPDIAEKFNSEELWDNFFSGVLAAGIGGLPSTISSIKGNQPSGININEGVKQFNRDNAINQQLNTQQNNQSNGKYSQNSNINQNVFQFEKDNNIKINNFKESASKYFNNSVQTHNFIDNISKIINDKNYNVIFDDKIVNNKEQSVNAQIKPLSNGEVEIRINPNSPKSGEFLIIHEATHAIETQEMKSLVLDYASQHDDFKQALNELKKSYGTDDVSSEVLADISGQLFGNQEFINNLSLEKPSVFKRIYNSIISLANKITGNSHEALFIKDLKNKWETAYRNTMQEQTMNNLNNNASFSIQQDSNGNNYVNVDTDQDIFEGKSLLEQTKIAKKYILDNFRKNGLIIDDNSVNVTSRTANEYTHSKTKVSKDVASSKMKASTELNNLLTIAEYSHSDADDGRHNIAKDGWDYYKVNFRVGNTNFEGLINIAKNGNQKTLYDITRIKKTSRVGSDNKSTTTNVMSFNDNNITQSKENVKLLTKYSMRNSQNNTLLKQQQLDIILNSNPAGNETATWIRNVEDIKTFEETLQDSDWEGWEKTGFDPDYDANMVREALNTGKITIYSSYPIEQGIFVTPSKMEAESYSGTGKVYSKEVNLDDVAWIDPTQGQYAKVDNKYSQNSSKWQEYLDKHYIPSGTRTNMNDIKIPTSKDINKINMPPVETKQNNSKVINPIEISQLTSEDSNTTPKLPKINRNNVNDGDSSFFNNIKDKTNMLNEEQKAKILSEDEVKYYDKVTNKESLNEAFDRLNNNGKTESLRWFQKDSTNADSTDVAEGWILMKQYADNKDYDSMVEVAKKLRDIGTKAGQTVQAFNIMERMTPEGMVKYAQSELQEAYDRMVKNKSKEWIDEHRSDFDLKPDDVQFIMDTMKEVTTMEDGYDKRVKLAEIQKLMTDKLPPTNGAGIKSWMRISMLFNPKTQVRNVAGNAIIMPVNSFGDLFASYADKIIAKKTGVRTTGKTNIKAMLKGIKEGAYQATNDYKKGINTKDMEGNRFEITESKNFSDKTLMGKSLNKVESMLNYVMDVGDRMFSQAAFENSLQNQLVLNNTTEITQDMLDIARTESLQRTWNDNNNYTKFVLDIRRMMNKIHIPGVESYGLGDVLIPFAKTPANLTKAIVDYSPAGLVKTIVEGNNLRKALTNGQYTPQMQHKFVQDLGKATAGTMLYVLGYALAKSGRISGESDDDKDVSNFMKNTLGISSYSIKIGGKSFTYDWAQPIAAPLSIMANVTNSKNNKGQALTEAVVGSLDTAGSILLEQSFLQSINDVLSDNDGVVSGLINEMLELPSRAVPTFSKQIADMVDGTQRTSFEYGKPIKSAVNSIKAKIPFVSKTLAPTMDTMGREVKKYGGKNNIFNVFLNPANVNTENISKSAEEIYRLYKVIGNTNIMPRVSPYYINSNNEKIILSSEQRTNYQKVSGEIIESEVEKLLNLESYKQLDDNQKSDVINDIVNYSYNIAQKNILNKELSQTYQKAYEYSKVGNISDYYTFKNSIDDTNKDTKKESISKYLINSKLNDKQIATLYSGFYSTESALNSLLELKIPIKEFIKLDSADIEGKYNTKTGKTISGSKKSAYIQYVNSLKLNISQKAILIKMNYNSYDNYNSQIINYVNQLNKSSNDKKVLLKQIGFDNYNKDVVNYIKSQNISVSEKEAKLKDLGFIIRNGKVYW